MASATCKPCRKQETCTVDLMQLCNWALCQLPTAVLAGWMCKLKTRMSFGYHWVVAAPYCLRIINALSCSCVTGAIASTGSQKTEHSPPCQPVNLSKQGACPVSGMHASSTVVPGPATLAEYELAIQVEHQSLLPASIRLPLHVACNHSEQHPSGELGMVGHLAPTCPAWEKRITDASMLVA